MCSLSPTTGGKLAIVDFSNEEILKEGSRIRSTACEEIRHGLENHGCFIALYDDKISQELRRSIFSSAEELFELPTEIKVQNINDDKPYHDYLGQNPSVPLHEGLGIDSATILDSVQSFTTLMWPHGNNSFCETSLKFAKEVAELEKKVIKMVFESYGVEKYSESHIESSTYLLRYLKYRAPEMNETTMAFPPHTDKSFLTILYQNHVSGLQISSRDGEYWIDVNFPPNSFVVMAGDAIQAWSNDRVLSSKHRVTMEGDGKKARYTIALFSFLNNNKLVEIPEEFVNDQNPRKFKPFPHMDLLHFYTTEAGRRSQNILKDFCGV